MAFVMLLLAGGRAPWIGALISLAFYFLVFTRDKRIIFFYCDFCNHYCDSGNDCF